MSEGVSSWREEESERPEPKNCKTYKELVRYLNGKPSGTSATIYGDSTAFTYIGQALRDANIAANVTYKNATPFKKMANPITYIYTVTVI